jgi:hypothetical protein
MAQVTVYFVLSRRNFAWLEMDRIDRIERVDDNFRSILRGRLRSGRLAQLGERRVRNAEAGGSIPPPSTNLCGFRVRFDLQSLDRRKRRVIATVRQN